MNLSQLRKKQFLRLSYVTVVGWSTTPPNKIDNIEISGYFA
jgi:hypothetical protein